MHFHFNEFLGSFNNINMLICTFWKNIVKQPPTYKNSVFKQEAENTNDVKVEILPVTSSQHSFKWIFMSCVVHNV